ncbi:MAG: hypothetical protein PHX43_04490, partial [Alphaproteobacteria bacterium]|nr:hypothetical protein [Alphaproteobacteria bacterium]
PLLDFEDWVENAVRLHEAMKIAPEKVAIVNDNAKCDRAAELEESAKAVERFLLGRIKKLPEEIKTEEKSRKRNLDVIKLIDGSILEDGAPIIFLGAWGTDGLSKRYNIINFSEENTRLAESYFHSKTFIEAAKREMVLCDMERSGENPGIYDVLIDMIKRGHGDAFVKVTAPSKYMALHTKLPSEATRKAILGSFSEDMRLGMGHIGVKTDVNKKNLFLVQEYVPMSY